MDPIEYPPCTDPDCVIEDIPEHTTNYARCKHFSPDPIGTETQSAPLCTDPVDCIDDPHFQDDPRCTGWQVSYLRPEDKVRYIPDGKVHIIDRRKDDDSGWWLLDEDRNAAGGLADTVWWATNQWEVYREPVDGELPDLPDIAELDLDSLTRDEIGQMATLVHESNELRVQALENHADQPGSLENAFDGLKILVLLEHIAEQACVSEMANLDFEGRRSNMIDAIEEKFRKGQEAMKAAEAAQRLAGGPIGRRGGVPQRPGRGGAVGPSPT